MPIPRSGGPARAVVSPLCVEDSGLLSELVKLFVERRELYPLADARRLAQISSRRLREAIELGAVHPVFRDASLHITWEDLASLVLDHWTLRRIERILRRAGQEHVLPPLSRFHTITIELPVYQIRLLHYLAVQRSVAGAPPLAASDVLEYELSALVYEEDLPAIDRVIPGFAAAATYPSLGDPSPGTANSCIYCGSDVPPPAEICAACVERHVPRDDGSSKA